MDLRNGNIKWQYQTEFPPRISPLVTGNIVFAGYTPFTEKRRRPKQRTGVILALDKETGEKLWEYDVNALIPQGGPSIGNGMLLVPTDKIQGQSKNTP